MKTILLFAALALMMPLAACVAPANTSADSYAGYSCQQLRAELQLVNAKLDDIDNRQVQNRIVVGAMSMMGYGVADAPIEANQLPGLKRRQDYLQHDLIARNCYAGG